MLCMSGLAITGKNYLGILIFCPGFNRLLVFKLLSDFNCDTVTSNLPAISQRLSPDWMVYEVTRGEPEGVVFGLEFD